jgi:hypothetical protein
VRVVGSKNVIFIQAKHSPNTDQVLNRSLARARAELSHRV